MRQQLNSSPQSSALNLVGDGGKSTIHRGRRRLLQTPVFTTDDATAASLVSPFLCFFVVRKFDRIKGVFSWIASSAMAEEHGFQAPEGHRLCANNCGSPAAQNYCPKCYRDIFLKEEEKTKSVNSVDSISPSQMPANRCSSCRKKVGLTGFRCRCGVTFCGTHRYPEMHACTFNYKALGREAIAKANPLIKAQKLDKI
nr:zinc finger A20 and AN1 domain-containing stress-associated protein 4-like [Ipomoea batatas]